MEKKYTAKEVAVEVLKKTQEMLSKAEFLKKYEASNSKKLGYKPSMADKEKMAEQSDKKLDVEAGKSKNQARIENQIAPDKNPKEKAEGNNKPGGNVLKDAEVVSIKKEEKDPANEIAPHPRAVGFIKLQKFMEHVSAKRLKKS